MTITAGRFDGTIAGVGTTSGTRFVLGAWDETPFGSITDVMIERPDGRRVLIAPTTEVGTFISETYGFDEVRVETLAIQRSSTRWRVTAGTLRVEIVPARRTALGWLLVAVPRPIAR
ncbi:MAG: hypothetical protein ABI345_07980, partial [Jatrophihabitans sp.]